MKDSLLFSSSSSEDFGLGFPSKLNSSSWICISISASLWFTSFCVLDNWLCTEALSVSKHLMRSRRRWISKSSSSFLVSSWWQVVVVPPRDPEKKQHNFQIHWNSEYVLQRRIKERVLNIFVKMEDFQHYYERKPLNSEEWVPGR